MADFPIQMERSIHWIHKFETALFDRVLFLQSPYSLKWSVDKKFEDDPRYSGAGKSAPKSHADFAFVEHMVYHMDEDDGRVAVLLPHGVLFRSLHMWQRWLKLKRTVGI